MNKTIHPIAYIKTDFKEKFGIPRQSGRVNDLIGEIIFEKEYRHPDALKEIEGFSHLWLLFDFSKNEYEKFSPTVRPPRLGGNKKVGVFASRAPFRPNGIGLSSVKLIEVKKSDANGLTLIVSGADLLDGTPIYDIKPYLPSTDCHIDAKGGYAEQFTDYKLSVEIPENLLNKIDENKKKALIGVLSEDPRPSYKNDEEIYGMNFAGYEIKFKVTDKNLIVLDIIK